MDVQPLIAHSINYGTVNVYADSALTQQIGQVDGGGLSLTAFRAENDAIYGDYVSGDVQGSG